MGRESRANKSDEFAKASSWKKPAQPSRSPKVSERLEAEFAAGKAAKKRR